MAHQYLCRDAALFIDLPFNQSYSLIPETRPFLSVPLSRHPYRISQSVYHSAYSTYLSSLNPISTSISLKPLACTVIAYCPTTTLRFVPNPGLILT